MIKKIIKKLKLKLNFQSGQYWETRYVTGGTSGAGSYGLHADAKASVFNQIIADYDLNEVVEFGCGDGNQLAMYNLPKYLGLDVAKTAIQNTAHKFSDDKSKSFMLYDPTAFFLQEGPLKFQTSISIDVLFHLPEDAIFNKYMDDLFACSAKYVIICSSNHTNNHRASSHVRHRNFTQYVDKNIPGWILKDTRDCIQSDGKVLDPFYVYIRG